MLNLLMNIRYLRCLEYPLHIRVSFCAIFPLLQWWRRYGWLPFFLGNRRVGFGGLLDEANSDLALLAEDVGDWFCRFFAFVLTAAVLVLPAPLVGLCHFCLFRAMKIVCPVAVFELVLCVALAFCLGSFVMA